MGLSFLLPQEAGSLSVAVRWGDYHSEEMEDDEGKKLRVWQRYPREEIVPVKVGAKDGKARVHKIAGSAGLELNVVEREITAEGFEEHLPKGTRSLSVFLVNRRKPVEQAPDSAFIFQPEIEISNEQSFVPRPDLRGARSEDWDDQIADLHYADVPAYATGHGVSVEWELVDGKCHTIKTAWIPTAEVEKTETVKISGLDLSMDNLGALESGDAAKTTLTPLVDQYRLWIDHQGKDLDDLSSKRRETATELIRLAGISANRIEQGIQTLGTDADALDAFRVMNRAVARALRIRLGIDDPEWRAFQLAFVLLNLPGIAKPDEPTREIVDLLFFPTGGGKTEAYLGLAAFAIVLRRLRNPGDEGRAGAGVSVIMRYTLRLLTLDQLARAAGLVCALELERESAPERFGTWPFEIGLWVGKAATPNVMGKKGESRSDSARSKVRQFKNDPRNKPSPIPLENCPWCNAEFEPASFTLLPNDDQPKELRIVCANFECDFSRDRPLPIVAVDEPIYRRLPSFVVATVDKFASLPWVGPSGALLGGADRYDSAGFYGPAEPGFGKRMKTPLQPPDLIIQDELHLISATAWHDGGAV